MRRTAIETTGSKAIGTATAAGAGCRHRGGRTGTQRKGSTGKGSKKQGLARRDQGIERIGQAVRARQEREEPDGTSQDVRSGFDQWDRVEPTTERLGQSPPFRAVTRRFLDIEEVRNAVEWVETTAATVDEARELALDQLGVDSDEAEFETIEEPRAAFRSNPWSSQSPSQGRAEGATGEGRTSATSEEGGRHRRRRQRSTGRCRALPRAGCTCDEGGVADAVERRSSPTGGIGQGDQRTDGHPGADGRPRGLPPGAGHDVRSRGRRSVDARGQPADGRPHRDDLGLLVGPRLATLDAVQEIARNALQRQAAGRSTPRSSSTWTAYRARRREALASFVTDACAQVRDDGTEVIFEVMSSVDRKQVHDLIAEQDGVESASEGEDPRRRVVLRAT